MIRADHLRKEIRDRIAAQQMILRATAPFAYLMAGPLAERAFGPLMLAGAPLAGSVGRVLGIGPGRGIALMFVLMGLAKIAITLLGYFQPRIRNVERELPDAI